MTKKDFFKKYEFRRKTLHLIFGIIFVFLINVFNDYIVIILLSSLVLSLLLSYYVKLKKPVLLMQILKWFDKPQDLIKFPAKGAIFYIFGVLLSVLLYDIKIASASIMILAVGDSMAHIIGRYYGKKKLIINKKKLLEGTLAGTFFGTIAASFFVPVPFAFFGAMSGMLIEAVEINFIHWDDNFSIPLISGLVMSLMLLI